MYICKCYILTYFNIKYFIIWRWSIHTNSYWGHKLTDGRTLSVLVSGTWQMLNKYYWMNESKNQKSKFIVVGRSYSIPFWFVLSWFCSFHTADSLNKWFPGDLFKDVCVCVYVWEKDGETEWQIIPLFSVGSYLY